MTPEGDNPEDRTDWVIDDLTGYVKAHRRDICEALLTVWRAWLRAGRPGEQGPLERGQAKMRPWHTVRAWGCVRAVLTWLGRPDPADCRAQLKARDGSAELATRLLDWIEAHHGAPAMVGALPPGISSSALLEGLRPKMGFAGAARNAPEGAEADARAELWAAVCHACKRRAGDVDGYSMGSLLRQHHDAPHGGRKLKRHDAGRWYVERILPDLR